MSFYHRLGSKRKRKSSQGTDSEDESGDETPEKRPRRDRLQRKNENRTVFVGNFPLKSNKKVTIIDVH